MVPNRAKHHICHHPYGAKLRKKLQIIDDDKMFSKAFK